MVRLYGRGHQVRSVAGSSLNLDPCIVRVRPSTAVLVCTSLFRAGLKYHASINDKAEDATHYSTIMPKNSMNSIERNTAVDKGTRPNSVSQFVSRRTVHHMRSKACCVRASGLTLESKSHPLQLWQTRMVTPVQCPELVVAVILTRFQKACR